MLRDISLEDSKELKGKLKQFNLTTWCICDLYLSHIGKYNSGSFKKAIVNVMEEETENNVIEDMIDVILIHKTFDFDRFFQMEDKYNKKKILLDVLHEGLMTMAKHEGWDTNSLSHANNRCLKEKLGNNWLYKNKYFSSPNKKNFAGIFCNWDIDKFEVTAVFFNKQKEEMERIKLYENEPHDIEPMGKMGWDKVTGEVYLFSKSEKEKMDSNSNYNFLAISFLPVPLVFQKRSHTPHLLFLDHLYLFYKRLLFAGICFYHYTHREM